MLHSSIKRRTTAPTAAVTAIAEIEEASSIVIAGILCNKFCESTCLSELILGVSTIQTVLRKINLKERFAKDTFWTGLSLFSSGFRFSVYCAHLSISLVYLSNLEVNMSARDKLITYSFKTKKGTSSIPESKRKLGNFFMSI